MLGLDKSDNKKEIIKVKFKHFKKKLKKMFQRNTIVKIVMVIASLSMLLPLLLPFFN